MNFILQDLQLETYIGYDKDGVLHTDIVAIAAEDIKADDDCWIDKENLINGIPALRKKI